MRCIDPRTVGFRHDGRTLAWSQKHLSKEFPTFQLPCGQCLECRLEYARQWAIRCVHEASTHPKNAFITLTYADEHLHSPYLQYRDFQLFMKKLRKVQNDPIGYFVTGEYGDLNKRPHWHACVFNWCPADGVYKRSNDRGDKIYTSQVLDDCWGKGSAEFGEVTFDSAGYCARYAAKKLGHDHDHDNPYQPISKKSSKHAIGKKWIEKFYDTDCFNQGYIILPGNYSQCSIPRYYEKWFQKEHPEKWRHYVTEIKYSKIKKAEERSKAEKLEYRRQSQLRGLKKKLTTRLDARKKITEEKFKNLLAKQKL